MEQITEGIGAPSRREDRGNYGKSSWYYLVPDERLTVKAEGYVGFVVFFEDGRVSDWLEIKGTPSLPEEAK